MDWKEVVIVVAAVIAATATLVVPYLTYRFALHQEHRKWLRERRLDTYVELLSRIKNEARVLGQVTKGTLLPQDMPKDLFLSNDEASRAQFLVSSNVAKLLGPWMRASAEVHSSLASWMRAMAEAHAGSGAQPPAAKDFPNFTESMARFKSINDETQQCLIPIVRAELATNRVRLPKKDRKRVRRFARLSRD